MENLSQSPGNIQIHILLLFHSMHRSICSTDHLCCFFADHHLPLDYNNAPIAALSVSMPTFRISGEKEKEVVQILWEAKHRIEAHFQVYGVDFGN